MRLSPPTLPAVKQKVALVALAGALAALPAAPASGAPGKGESVQCGAIVKRDVRLTADLVDCPGDGLVVGRPNVSIDLNGHTIAGAFAGDGINNSRGFDRVEVLDGTITNFKNGVHLDRAARNRLSGLTLSRNHQGMLLSASPATVVTDGNVSNNGESMRVGEGIVVRDGSHGTQFARMFVHGNAAVGISAFDSDRVRIVASNVSNFAGGITIVRSANSAVLDSTLQNAGTGVESVGARELLVRGNVVASGQASGVLLRGSTGGRVEDNTIRGAINDGIAVSGDGNVVTANRVLSSLSNGIAVYAGGDNAVTGNEARALEDGIFVAAGVTGAYLARNLANGSNDDGIDVRTPSASLTDNTANDNGDYGIEAVPGVTDGGGNRASGNGNPAQCLGFACTS